MATLEDVVEARTEMREREKRVKALDWIKGHGVSADDA
jgi:hypothetical protein